MAARTLQLHPMLTDAGVARVAEIGYDYSLGDTGSYFARGADVRSHKDPFADARVDTRARGRVICEPGPVVDIAATYSALGRFDLAAMIEDWPRLPPENVTTHLAHLRIASEDQHPRTRTLDWPTDWQWRGRITLALARLQPSYLGLAWTAMRSGDTDPAFVRDQATRVQRHIDAFVHKDDSLREVEWAEAANVLRISDVATILLADTRPEVARFWEHAARAFPDPYRARALSTVGFHAHLVGDHDRAQVATSAALELNPRDAVAQLLQVTHEVRPDRFAGMLNALATEGAVRAAELGVDLPDPLPCFRDTASTATTAAALVVPTGRDPASLAPERIELPAPAPADAPAPAPDIAL